MSKPHHLNTPKPPLSRKPSGDKTQKTYWLYGRHPVTAALQNQKRHFVKVLLSKNTTPLILELLKKRNIAYETAPPKTLESFLPTGAVHQGIIALVTPLDHTSWLSQYLQTGVENIDRILVLDQVTDPHNVGAILRSAAVFGVKAVLSPSSHSPQESGTLAKSASGALDVIPYIPVKNLQRTLLLLKKEDFWIVGLDGTAKAPLEKAKDLTPLVIILGAEGKGLRRLTLESCDLPVHIPMVDSPIDSLNVSNAAAIALYTVCSQHLQ